MVLLMAGATIWSADRTRIERAAEVREQAETAAAAAATTLDQYFSSLDAMAAVLIRLPAVKTFNRNESNRLFAGLLRDQPLVLNVVLRDPAGLIRAAGAGGDRQQPSPGMPAVADVIAAGHPLVSQLTKGPLTGKPTIIQDYPVRGEDGPVIGVVSFGLNLLRLQSVFENIPLPEGSVVTLVDQSGRVLARSRDAERYIGTSFGLTPAHAKDPASSVTQTDADGVERFHGNAVVNRGPWLVSVGIPSQVVTDRLTPLFQRNVGIGISALVLVLLLSLWLSHQTSRGVTALRSAAQRIADGDLSPPAGFDPPNLEIAQLQEAFGTMAANLRGMRDALDRQVEQERKMREALQSLQRQVVRQERLAAVGVLVSGVAHELNNPLQAILGTAELIERNPGLGPETLEEIAFLKTQSTRAREIIRNLSRFGSQQSGPPSLIDLRDVITEVVQLRRRDLDLGSITLDIEVSSSRKVYANFTELEQVVLNFVINAQQAIELAGRNRGRIVIRVFDAARKVRLSVQDDGPGITSEDEAKLFQPFFTTKPVGKGTGLGLSVSYGIIESYGGVIGHKSNEWGGATFFFELPAAESSMPAGAAHFIHTES
jgi:signal transduction histidine kinase